ncbi:PAC2 family protein [Spiractinospora alimapuensis]|uniref:PAC2 family protein n=1 Tax=Spiractinospora alimapuensis TaxID=2820884 RepID=UPI002ED59F7E
MAEFPNLPDLVEPVMVAAFEGWNDAGEAASAATEHLASRWETQEVVAVESDEYYDFQVSRPRARIVDGVSQGLQWPATRLSVARPEGAQRDVVLMRGVEPNMRWRAFCSELVTVAQRLGVRRVVLLGALLADSPHTRPIPVTATVSTPELGDRLDLETSSYEGPTGVVGALHDAFTEAGMDAVSLWAAIPHYAAQPPCPKGTLALLRRVEDAAELSVPMGDLPEEARAWERGVDELADEDSDVASYVRSLEEAKDAAELPEASGDAIARDFERYLKRRDGGKGSGA